MSMFNLLRRITRLAIDTTTPSVQVNVESLADEVLSDIEVIEPYGMTTCPPDDVQEGMCFFTGGELDNGVALGWLDKVHRPKGLKPGEVKFYSKFGQSIFFDENGNVKIEDGTGSTIDMVDGKVTITPSSGECIVQGTLTVTQGISGGGGATITGDVKATGNVEADQNLKAGSDAEIGGKSFNGHKHGGVAPGGDETTPPV